FQSQPPSSTSFTEASPLSSTPPVSCFPIPNSETVSLPPWCRFPTSRSRSRRSTNFSKSGGWLLSKSPPRALVLGGCRAPTRSDDEGRVLREQILLQV